MHTFRFVTAGYTFVSACTSIRYSTTTDGNWAIGSLNNPCALPLVITARVGLVIIEMMQRLILQTTLSTQRSIQQIDQQHLISFPLQ
jgi:hypothetical protein